MSDVAVKDFFAGLEQKLNAKPEMMSGVNCVVQFLVDNFACNVSIKESRAVVAEGRAKSADCTITVSEKDFIDIISGKLQGQLAFMTGRLKVSGNMNLALRLGSLLM